MDDPAGLSRQGFRGAETLRNCDTIPNFTTAEPVLP